MSTTQLELFRHIAKELGYASGTCSTAGSTTTIVDASADSGLESDDSTLLHQNAWAMIEADSAGTPLNVGEVRRVKTYTPSTGTLTTDRAFTNDTTTTQSYGLYHGRPPKRVGMVKGLDEYINEVLRAMLYRTYSLLTVITDGDMETSGVTNWTSSMGTDPTKTTTYSTFGKQALSFDPSTADAYVYTANYAVQSGSTLDVAVDLYGADGKLVLYDVTNSEEIDSKSSTVPALGAQGWNWLKMRATVPSDCESVRVHLVNTSTSAVVWDNLTLRRPSSTEMALPSWLIHPEWIEDVFYLHHGTGANADDSHSVDDRERIAVRWWRVAEDTGGTTPFKLLFDPRTDITGHLFVQAMRPYADLSAITSTTDADKDWVRAWVLTRVYHDIGDTSNRDYWLQQARQLDRIHQPRTEKVALKFRRPY